MNKEKGTEEIANDLRHYVEYDEWSAREYGDTVLKGVEK